MYVYTHRWCIFVSICMHIYKICIHMHVHIYMYIYYTYIYIYRKNLSLSKITLTTLARFGNRGMLASYDIYVRLDSCQILAKRACRFPRFLRCNIFPTHRLTKSSFSSRDMKTFKGCEMLMRDCHELNAIFTASRKIMH